MKDKKKFKKTFTIEDFQSWGSQGGYKSGRWKGHVKGRKKRGHREESH